jgi:hypothetical protein
MADSQNFNVAQTPTVERSQAKATKSPESVAPSGNTQAPDSLAQPNSPTAAADFSPSPEDGNTPFAYEYDGAFIPGLLSSARRKRTARLTTRARGRA